MLTRLLLLALLLAASPALAQFHPVPGESTKPNVGGGGGYVGPGDQGITLTDCWGAELCTSGYSGKAANVCQRASFTTCADVAYDRTGTPGTNANYGGLLVSGTNSLTASPISCSGDTGCVYKKLYSNYSTGCDLASAAVANAPAVLMTSTLNGHVSIGDGGASVLALTCSEGSNISDVSEFGILKVTTQGATYGLLSFGSAGSSTIAPFIYLANVLYASWWDSGNTRHDPGSEPSIPNTSTVFSWGAHVEASASAGTSTGMIQQTAGSACSASCNGTYTANAVVTWATSPISAAPPVGHFPSFAYISPHTTTANVNTVLAGSGGMCRFWTGSTSC